MSSVPISSYHEYYSLPKNDPHHGDYGKVYSLFETGIEAPEDTLELYEMVLNTTDVQPHIYLHCTHYKSTEKPVITVVHHPFCCISPMGMGPATTDYYALLGDVFGGTAPSLIHWLVEPFTPTSNRKIPSTAILDAAFAADEDCGHVGPYDNTAQGLDIAMTWPLMWVPPRFAHHVFGQPFYTPRKIWQGLGYAVQSAASDEAELLKYTPLLNWIKAACTLGVTGLALIGQDSPQQPYPITEALASKCKELLQHDILGLFAGPTPTGITQVASAVTTLTDHLVAAQSA